MLILLGCSLFGPEKEPRETGIDPFTTDETDTDADSDADTDADTDTDTDTDTDADTDTDTTPTEPSVCARWNADRADVTEATWSGNVGSCDPGDMDAAGRARALTVLNLYRYLAGLPEVTANTGANDDAQSCALMMHANNTLSHDPPTSWTCYDSAGADAAGNSNIASGPAVMAMDMYMQDWGNETTIGHRRWILSNQLGPVGIGSTSRYSCLKVIGGSGSAGADWQAWPPPGDFPYEAVSAGGYLTLDETGWTLQSDRIDLSRASVTVTDGGSNKAMTVDQLLQYYGSTYAIKMTPRGWASEVGHTYRVEVTGVSPTISYEVTMVGC